MSPTSKMGTAATVAETLEIFRWAEKATGLPWRPRALAEAGGEGGPPAPGTDPGPLHRYPLIAQDLLAAAVGDSGDQDLAIAITAEPAVAARSAAYSRPELEWVEVDRKLRNAYAHGHKANDASLPIEDRGRAARMADCLDASEVEDIVRRVAEAGEAPPEPLLRRWAKAISVSAWSQRGFYPGRGRELATIAAQALSRHPSTTELLSALAYSVDAATRTFHTGAKSDPNGGGNEPAQQTPSPELAAEVWEEVRPALEAALAEGGVDTCDPEVPGILAILGNRLPSLRQREPLGLIVAATHRWDEKEMRANNSVVAWSHIQQLLVSLRPRTLSPEDAAHVEALELRLRDVSTLLSAEQVRRIFGPLSQPGRQGLSEALALVSEPTLRMLYGTLRRNLATAATLEDLRLAAIFLREVTERLGVGEIRGTWKLAAEVGGRAWAFWLEEIAAQPLGKWKTEARREHTNAVLEAIERSGSLPEESTSVDPGARELAVSNRDRLSSVAALLAAATSAAGETDDLVAYVDRVLSAKAATRVDRCLVVTLAVPGLGRRRPEAVAGWARDILALGAEVLAELEAADGSAPEAEDGARRHERREAEVETVGRALLSLVLELEGVDPDPATQCMELLTAITEAAHRAEEEEA